MSSAVALMATSTPAYAQQAEARRDFNIPAQPLASALIEFSRQSDTVVTAPAGLTRHKLAPALHGNYTPSEALRVLLAGSGLRSRIGSGGSFIIEREDERVASASSVNEPASSAGQDPNADEANEIVVTGTLIRGVTPPSRVSSFTGEQVQRQGFATLRDFVQKLPENFNGGASENTAGAFAGGGGSALNTVSATGINLRGLGNDATLVLLNGQRVAPASRKGNFVDISMIPLSAVERIDILPDGASATYGSDAVGGVVNVSLRSDFNGAETAVRYGSVTSGNREELRASQAIGHAWQSGSVLAVYDFAKETPLLANDRAISRGAVAEPFWLLPRTQTHSALLVARQDLAPDWEVFGNALYTHRDILTFSSLISGYSNRADSTVENYSIAGGVRGSLGRALNIEVTANYARSDTDSDSFDLAANTSLGANLTTTDILSIDGRVSGSILSLPAGDLRFAVGGQYRRETYDYEFTLSPSSPFQDSRNVEAAYLELSAPIIRGTATSLPLLELTFADRQEWYSDFGSTNNPKVGLIMRPLRRLTLKASYGTSFVAPLLADLNPMPTQIVAIPGSLFDLVGGSVGSPDSVVIFGGNPTLMPQKSRNFSAGVELRRGESGGFDFYTNYFSVRYRDRISNLQGYTPNVLEVFLRESELGPTIVERDPDPLYVQQLISHPIFQNAGVSNLTTIGAVVDSRSLNLSSVNTDGLDFGASYALQGDWGQNTIGLAGTYIFNYETRFSNTSPTSNLLNTAYNPIDLKIRAFDTLQLGSLTTSMFVNYVDSYYSTTARTSRVRSWTTFDLNVRYDFSSSRRLLDGASVSLGAVNIFNASPPRIPGATATLPFDAANANALGRFVYVEFRKRF